MLNTIDSINFILPLLYGSVFGIYLYDFIKDDSKVYNAKRVFLFVTLFVHVLYLLFRTIEFNHPPITNKFEIFTVLAFSLAFAYFLLELLTDVRGTGAFIILFSLVFQLISSIFIQDLMEVKEVLRNRLLGVHVMSALLGYSGFTIAAVHGVLFFLLYKDIKLNKYGLIFKRLPSLELLEKLNPNYIDQNITRSFDEARSCYITDKIKFETYEELLESINHFYIHLIRHTNSGEIYIEKEKYILRGF